MSLMSKNKLLMIEYNKSKSEHKSINQALYYSVAQALDESFDIEVACSKIYFEKVFMGINAVSPTLSVFTFSSGFFVGMLIEMLNIFKSIPLFKKYKVLVFLSLSPLGRLLVSFLIFFGVFNNNKVYIVMHSEYSVLFDLDLSFKKRVYKYIVKLSLWLSKNRVGHIFLSSHIPIEFDLLGDRVLVLNHPVIFPDVVEKKMPSQLDVSFVGLASYEKGLAEFIDISDKFSEDKFYNFSIAGKVCVQLTDDVAKNVIYKSQNFISEHVMSKLLSDSNLALFFYQDDYNYIASGAVLDCLKYEIPILSLNNKLFMNMSLKYNFLRVFNTKDEMSDFLMDKIQVERFINDCEFKSAKLDYSVENASVELKYFIGLV